MYFLQKAHHSLLELRNTKQHLSTFLKKKLKKIVFIFREKGREGGREGEKHQCVVASSTPPARDLACNPGMCPDWESNL